MGTLYQLGFLIFRQEETTMANSSIKKKRREEKREIDGERENQRNRETD